MNKAPVASSRRSKFVAALFVAAASALAALGLLSIMLLHRQELVRWGLTGHVWYVLLLLIGLAAAVCVFALFKSYARYTGKALDGTVELGGPAVVMLLIVVLGFYLVPAPLQRFDVTVFLHGEAGRQAVVLRNTGRLQLDFGADPRVAAIGGQGEARFVGVPADMRGRAVPVSLDADRHELVEPDLRLTLDREVFYVPVRAKRLRLTGTVSDAQGRPLAQARASIAGRNATTDEDGRFDIVLPADLPEGDRTVTISARGYEPWIAQAVPGGNTLRARLVPSTTGK